MRAALTALLFLSFSAPALSETFDVETRSFSSPDKAFTATVSYSGTGGGGKARVELRAASGKKISLFETDLPPFSVTVSGDGRRLMFFCGSWGQSVSLYLVRVYSSSGKMLASHKLQMNGPAGEGFSDDYSIYAVAGDQGEARSILVIDAVSGKALWRRSFKEQLSGLKVSSSGKNVLAVFSSGRRSYRAVVFDKAGKELWSSVIKTANTLTPRVFGASSFELWEGKSVYDEDDGYWHGKIVKKRRYRITGDGVKESGTQKVYEDMK